jgi:signal peptidase II
MKRAKQVLYLVISLLVVIADQGLKNYIVTNFKIGDETHYYSRNSFVYVFTK